MSSTSSAILQQSANISRFTTFDEIRDFIKSFITVISKSSSFTKILDATTNNNNNNNTTSKKKSSSTQEQPPTLDILVANLAQQIISIHSKNQESSSSQSNTVPDAEPVTRSWFSLVTALCQPIDEKHEALTETAKAFLSSNSKVRDAFCLFVPRNNTSNNATFITSAKSATDFCNSLGFLIAQNDQAKKKIFGPSEKFQNAFVFVGCSQNVTASPEASDAWLRCFCKLLANNTVNVKAFYGQSLRVREALCGIAMSRKAVASENVARWWCTAITNVVFGDRSKYIFLAGKPFPKQPTMREIVQEDEEKTKRVEAKKHGYTLQASTSSDFAAVAAIKAKKNENDDRDDADFVVVNDKMASANISRCFCNIARYIHGDEAAEWFCKAICKLTVDATFDEEKDVVTEEGKIKAKKATSSAKDKTISSSSTKQQNDEHESTTNAECNEDENNTNSTKSNSNNTNTKADPNPEDIQQTNPFTILALGVSMRTAWQSYKQQLDQFMRYAQNQAGNGGATSAASRSAAAARVAPPSIRVSRVDLQHHFVRFATVLAVDEMAAALVSVGRQIKTASPIHFFCEAIVRLCSIEKTWQSIKETFCKDANHVGNDSFAASACYSLQLGSEVAESNGAGGDNDEIRKTFTGSGDMFSTVEVRTTMVTLQRFVVIAAAKEELERKKAKRKEKLALKQQEKEEKEKLNGMLRAESSQMKVKNNNNNNNCDDDNDDANENDDDENHQQQDDENDDESFSFEQSNSFVPTTTTSTSDFLRKNTSKNYNRNGGNNNDYDDDDDDINEMKDNDKIVSESNETKTDRLLRTFLVCLETLANSSSAATELYAKDEVRNALVSIAPKLRSSFAALTWLSIVFRLIQYGGRRGISMFANSEDVCNSMAHLAIFMASSASSAYSWMSILLNLMEYDEPTRKIYVSRLAIRRAVLRKTRGCIVGAGFETFCQIVYSFVSFQGATLAHQYFGHGKEGERFADNFLEAISLNCPDNIGELGHRTLADILLLLWETSETAKKNFLEDSGRLHILKDVFCECASKSKIMGEAAVSNWMKLIKVAASHQSASSSTTATTSFYNNTNSNNNKNNASTKNESASTSNKSTNNDVFGDEICTKAYISISNQAIFSRDCATSWLETIAHILVSSAPIDTTSENENENNNNTSTNKNNNKNNAEKEKTPRERFLTSKQMIVSILKVFAVSEGRQPSMQQQQLKASEDEQRKQREEKSKKMSAEREIDYNALVQAAGGFSVKPATASTTSATGPNNINNNGFSNDPASLLSVAGASAGCSSSRSANVSRMMLEVQAAQESMIRRLGPDAFDPKTILAEQKREKDRALQEMKIKNDRAQFRLLKGQYDRSELTSDEREIFERRLQEREIAKQKRIDEGLEPEDDDNEE